jgi:hypothetical protein
MMIIYSKKKSEVRACRVRVRVRNRNRLPSSDSSVVVEESINRVRKRAKRSGERSKRDEYFLDFLIP